MALVFIGAVSASGAWAQDAAPAAAPAATEAAKPADGGVEEIIVTSRLREESIQEVPIAVTAFNQEAIAALAPSTLRDFDGLTPNVFIGMNTAGPSAGAIFIRGLGYADIEKTQTSNVGVVVDGVSMPSSTGQLIDTFDIEQITVNRGPQAVLLGRNTSAGTIVVRRGQPKLGEYDVAGKVTFGSYNGAGGGNQFTVQGMANMPLSDETLAVRAGVTYKTSQGFWKNSFTGEDRGAIDYLAFNLKLLYQPTDEFSVVLNWDYIKDRGDIPPQDPITDGNDPFVNRSDRSPKEAQVYDLSLPSVEINWETPLGKLTSISAYWNSRDLVFQDFDGGVFNAADPTLSDNNDPFARLHTRRHQFLDVISQEIRLAGDLMDGKLQYLTGFYYTDEEVDFEQQANIILHLDFGLPAGFCPLAGFQNGPISNQGGQFCVFPLVPSLQTSSQDTTSYGVFGSLGYDIFDWWSVSGGLRWIKEKKEFTSRFQDFVGGVPGTTNIFVPSTSDSWDDIVFEATTSFRIMETANAYYRFAQGFRSGGFSIRGTDPARASFDPEGTDAHEIGVKSTWFEDRLTVNVAGFYTKVGGGQFSSIITIPTPPGTNTLILNAQAAEVYGAELETSLRLGDDITLYGSLGYQDGGALKNLQNPEDLADPTNGNFPRPPGPQVELANDFPLFRSPKISGTIGANYGINLGAGRLVSDVRWKHQDEYFIGVAGGGVLLEPNYEQFELTVAYETQFAEHDVRAAFVGKNLSDSRYREQILFLGNGGFQGWGPPRYLGIELSFDL